MSEILDAIQTERLGDGPSHGGNEGTGTRCKCIWPHIDTTVVSDSETDIEIETMLT